MRQENIKITYNSIIKKLSFFCLFFFLFYFIYLFFLFNFIPYFFFN